MRHFWVAVCAAGLVVIAGSGGGRTQVPLGAPAPVAPGGAAATAVAGPGGVAVAEAAPKAGFFKRLCVALDECRRKICKTPAGQMLNNMTMPISGFTGGVIPPFCPIMPSAKDLAQPGVAGAAAAAQKEALEAGARRDAVRFLGTLDCRYFPDTAPALAGALRGDSSECVRYEAALVLNRGCCCTEITIKALEASVSGTEMDGFPAERSVRVRCAAALALERCLACYVPPPADELPPVIDGSEKGPGGIEGGPPAVPVKPSGDVLPPPTPAPPPKEADPAKPAASQPAAAKAPAPNRLPSPATVERARRTLNEFNALLAAAAPPMVSRPGVPTAGRQSVYQLLKDTAESPTLVYPTAPMMTNEPAPAPAKVTTVTPTPVKTPTGMASPTLTGPGATLSRPMTFTPAEPAAPELFPAGTVSSRPAVAPEPVRTPTPTVAPKPMPAATAPAVTPEPARTPTPAVVTPKPISAAPVVAPKPMSVSPAAPPAPPVSAAPPKPQPVPSPAPTASAPPRLVPASLASPAPNDKVYEWGKQVLQSPSAADRHNAIRQLVQYDWKQHPMVTSVLLAGAKTDPNNVVRVDCLRHLAAYKMDHPQVLSDLAAMADDADPWVRQEAAQALGQIKQVP